MRRILTLLVLVILLFPLGGANLHRAHAQSYADFPVFVDLAVPLPPTPLKADGKLYLLYELHITNFSGESLTLTRLDVLADNDNSALLARYEGAELSTLLKRPGITTELPEPNVIGAGLRAVVFLQLAVDPTVLPTGLRHQLFFQADSAGGEASERMVESEATRILRSAPVVIAAPLRGPGWLALNGLSNTSGHRRELQPGQGKMRIAQRYAIDWVQIAPDGQLFHGDPAQNEAWYAYGAEVLAVADGVVVSQKDGVPQNIPLSGELAVPLTSETIGGNYVILDIGRGHFAYYAHLQPQSLRVKLGDKVKQGQVLGLVGNSGNSDLPHLHFHVTNANSPLGAEGIPYVFKRWEREGMVSSLDIFESSEGWQAQGEAEPRQLELPLENTVVQFP